MEYLFLFWMIVIGIAMTHDDAGQIISVATFVLMMLGNAVLFFL
jgi:hypothetical protein